MHTKELSRVRTAGSNWTSAQILDLIYLKLPHDPHGHASSSTQCLFSIGHGLRPRIACSPLVLAYTHAFFMPRVSHPFLFPGSHFVDFIFDRMYLWTTSTGFIACQGNISYYGFRFSVCFPTRRESSACSSIFMKLGRRDRVMPFPRTFARSKTQTVSSKISTCFISLFTAFCHPCLKVCNTFMKSFVVSVIDSYSNFSIKTHTV